MNMIKSLEFRKVNNVFQEQLKSDIEQMKNNSKIFVSADKSRYTYMLQQEEYTKLLKEKVTKTYKKSTRKKLFNINRTAKKIAEKFSIYDRIDKMQGTKAYITIKDHKKISQTKFPVAWLFLQSPVMVKSAKWFWFKSTA